MKPKVAIFQKDLKLGGIQKSLINLLSSIDTDKYEIDLYLFSHDNFYSANFSKKVSIFYEKKQNYFARFIPFRIYYRLKRVKINKQYDIAIDFNGYQNITATYALKTEAKQHAYWVHNDLYVRHDVQEKGLLKFVYLLILQLTRNKWQRFDQFVGVSEGVLDGFRHDFPDKEFVVIPNLINIKEIIEKSNEKVDDLDVNEQVLNLSAVGRLEHQKGIDLLISKMTEVVKKRQDIHLYLIGEGSLRVSLEDQVKGLGVDQYVTFLGAKKNPFKYLAKMDGLVLYSRYEGQGMVLMEARVLGLPLYFPKHLEKYNVGLVGTDDIVKTLIDAKKPSARKADALENYNRDILSKLSILFSGK